MKQHGAPWLITVLALMAAFFPALKATGPMAAAVEESKAAQFVSEMGPFAKSSGAAGALANSSRRKSLR